MDGPEEAHVGMFCSTPAAYSAYWRYTQSLLESNTPASGKGSLHHMSM